MKGRTHAFASGAGRAAALLLLCGAVANAQDAAVPDDYADIQSAVLRAVDRDGDGLATVLVRPGTYYESVLIQRSGFELIGSGPELTTIHALSMPDAVRVLGGSRVTVKGFTLTGAVFGSGIELVGAASARVEGNVVLRNRNGIVLRGAGGGVVAGNEVLWNAAYGVMVNGSRGVSVAANDIHDNMRYGLFAERTTGLAVKLNALSSNGGDGACLLSALNARIVENTMDKNQGNGLRLEKAWLSRVVANTALENGLDGMHTRATVENVFTENRFTSNGEWGIHQKASTDDDFDGATPGVQPPPGSNDLRDNRRGMIFREP